MRYKLMAILAVVIFSTYPSISKPLLINNHPLIIVAATSILAAFVITFLFGAIPEIKKGIGAGHKDAYLVLMAFLTGVVGPGLYMIGLRNSSVVNAVLMMTFVTPIAAFLAHVFLKEKISRWYLLGLVFLFGGMLVYSTEFFQIPFRFGWNDLYFLGAAAGYAASDIVYKKFLSHMSHELILLSRNLLGGLFILLGIMIFSVEIPMELSLNREAMLGIGLIVLLPMLFGQTLWYNALEYINAKEAAFIDALYPISSAAVAYFILGEHMNAFELLGGAVMILGLIISQIHGHRRHPHLPTLHKEEPAKHLRLRHLKHC